MENATPPSTPPGQTPPPSTPPPATPPPSNPNAHRQWDMWAHLSALAGVVVPFGNLLGPLIIWQMKRHEFPSVDEHGKESLNFQLSATIYLCAGILLAFAGTLLVCIGVLIIPLLAVIYIGSIVYAVIAGIKANDGMLYRYPFNLRLIK
jgi:uncharacterized protein